MGGFLSKEGVSAGYYIDMVEGYISKAGGFPYMIHYPKALQRLPKYCPYCKSSSGLIHEQIKKRLTLEREKYQIHMDKIISFRVADGERNPYPRDRKETENLQKDSYNLLRYFKKNSVLPEKEEKAECENPDDPFYFPIHTNSLVVCECMTQKHIKAETPEEDERLDMETIVVIKPKKDLIDSHSHTENDQESDTAIDRATT